MERQDFGRSRGVQLVRHADEVLGQRENAKIHEGSGEAGDTMAQGAYADRAARVRRRVSPGGLSPKPPHPNTARLFIDFLLSKPAQQRLRALRRIPARSDVEPISPRMEQSKLKITIQPRETGAQYREAIKDFREIFGL